MRVIPMILAMALGIALALPAAAQNFMPRNSASFAGPGFAASFGGSRARVAVGKGYGTDRGARHKYRKYKYNRHYRPRRWRYRGIYLYGRRYDDRPRYREPPPPAAPPPPVVAAPVEPPPPPDPRGPLRLNPARGVLPAGPAYEVGEALPIDLPHVTLDWRQFDLAEPPPGQIYARVKSDVLLITATGRVVQSVVPPG